MPRKAGSSSRRNFSYPYPLDSYPKNLHTKWTQLKTSTLRRYANQLNVPLRRDSSTEQTAVAVGRNFKNVFVVDEVETLHNFMNLIKTVPTFGTGNVCVGKESSNHSKSKSREKKTSSGSRHKYGDTRTSKKNSNYKSRTAARRIAEENEARLKEAVALATAEADADAALGLSNGDIKRYCICNGPSYGDMIGCDYEKCVLEWFHLNCVGLNPLNKPKGKWYCPQCRGSSSVVCKFMKPRGRKPKIVDDKSNTTKTSKTQEVVAGSGENNL
eukprot:GSMAST32.ASY1.ANO1.1287.1 assembled CDS